MITYRNAPSPKLQDKYDVTYWPHTPCITKVRGMEDWKARLKDHLKRHGYSQESVAADLGKTQGTVSHWLAGRREINLTEFMTLRSIIGADPCLILVGKSTTPALIEGSKALAEKMAQRPDEKPTHEQLMERLRKKKQTATKRRRQVLKIR